MYILGGICQWLHLPGFVRPMRHYDGDTGTLVEITMSHFYTKITVNGKEFFFNRESGKYDGFGGETPEAKNLEQETA